jgi:pilus assembly protein CpaF
MEGEVIVMQDIFRFVPAGSKDGRILGRLQPTGVRPKFADKIKQAGIRLRAELFGVPKDLDLFSS